MRNRTFAVVATLGVAALSVACSSDSKTESADAGEISLDDWAVKVDAQCEKLVNESLGLAPPNIPDVRNPAPADLPVLGEYLDAQASVMEEFVRAIDDLPLPDEKQDTANDFIDSIGKYHEQLVDAAKAARDGDLEAYTTSTGSITYSEQLGRPYGDQLGVTKCQGSGT